MQKSRSPSSTYNLRITPSSSPSSRPLPHDYPVFTPSYEDEPVSAFHHHKNLTLSENWDVVDGDEEEDQDLTQTYLSDPCKTLASRKALMPFQESSSYHHQSHVYTVSESLRSSSPLRFYTSGRSNCGSVDFRSVSSCNEYNKQRSGFDTMSLKSSNLVVPLTDSHSAVVSSQPRNRGGGGVMSWLFPKLKKKQKSINSRNGTEKSEDVSDVLKEDSGFGIEKLKTELMEAKRSRDAALTEVIEMKSSLGELSEKLQYLESYCDSLKKALREATEVVASQENNVARGSGEKNLEMPVSEEVMVEGFLQIVSESRLSIKQFLKTLVSEIDEEDLTLIANINTLLQPHNLSFDSKYSKVIQYHLEAILSQSIFQDFENCIFQKNGKPKMLDPVQDRLEKFASFASLRNLSWNEVLKKGTKYYSEEFSRFCDEKMSLIITTLNWTRPWSEQMLQAFFVAAKCVWLLHLLAFSFKPALGILRVEENRGFEPSYMEDMGADRDRQRSSSCRGPARVKVMVMPGFYVQDRVLRCKVLCRYKTLSSSESHS